VRLQKGRVDCGKAFTFKIERISFLHGIFRRKQGLHRFLLQEKLIYAMLSFVHFGSFHAVGVRGRKRRMYARRMAVSPLTAICHFCTHGGAAGKWRNGSASKQKEWTRTAKYHIIQKNSLKTLLLTGEDTEGQHYVWDCRFYGKRPGSADFAGRAFQTGVPWL
jgi:hypothetical protein